jgi:hypothetical protein
VVAYGDDMSRAAQFAIEITYEACTAGRGDL